MKLRLPDSISSSQDIDELQLEIREYTKWFGQNTIKKRVGVKKSAEPPTISAAAAQTIRNWESKKTLSVTSLDKLCDELKNYGHNAPLMTITLAAPPTSDVKQKLIGWCRDNIRQDILITFKFNSTLLGGMVVQFGSHIHDWSFRRQIMDARSHFPEILRNV